MTKPQARPETAHRPAEPRCGARGGLRRAALAILMGPPRSGKTILAGQTAFAASAAGSTIELASGIHVLARAQRGAGMLVGLAEQRRELVAETRSQVATGYDRERPRAGRWRAGPMDRRDAA